MGTKIVVFVFLVTFCRAKDYPPCATGLKCSAITPPATPNLQFSCAFAKSTSAKGQVYFMHGNDGAGSKGMFFDIMQKLLPLGFDVLACDQRGYSPGASPNNYSAYNYNELAADIFSLVDASGFSQNFGGKFHLVTHDQGTRTPNPSPTPCP